MNLPAPALIRIRDSMVITCRIASFTWQTPNGFAWVEDSYLDGGTHSFHRLDGKMTLSDGGIFMALPEGHALIFSQENILADSELCPPDRLDDFLGLQDNFVRLGLDWAEEFARITEIVRPELGS